MGRMSRIFIAAAEDRADTAEHDLSYLKSTLRRLAEDAEQIVEGFAAMQRERNRNPGMRSALLAKLGRVAGELRENGQE